MVLALLRAAVDGPDKGIPSKAPFNGKGAPRMRCRQITRRTMTVTPTPHSDELDDRGASVSKEDGEVILVPVANIPTYSGAAALSLLA